MVSSMETVNRYYRDVFDSLLAGFIAYDFGRAIGFSRKPLDNEELLLNDGTRGQRHEPEQSLESFVARMLHNDELEDYKHKKKLKDKSLSE